MRVNFSKSLNLFTPAGLLALGLIWAGSAPAQSQNSSPSTPTTTSTENDINRRELTNFDRWMDDHPQVYQQLRNNPSLINDPNWLGQHPGVQKFLQNHPGVREEIKENPRRFINHEERFERKGGDISRAEAARGDRFLDSHSEIAEALRRDPKLIDNKQFVQNHPELREYLKNHPGVREDWKQNPNAFMKRQRQFEKHEGGARHGKGRI